MKPASLPSGSFSIAMRKCLLHIVLVMVCSSHTHATPVLRYTRYEHTFTSAKDYTNPLYDVKSFRIQFRSPTGRLKTVNGFWDGGRLWRVRFAPEETGTWTLLSACSDSLNGGLHAIADEHPGLVALHPGGGFWIGEAYAQESWLDIIGYQSGHNTQPSTLQFINKGPVASR